MKNIPLQATVTAVLFALSSLGGGAALAAKPDIVGHGSEIIKSEEITSEAKIVGGWSTNAEPTADTEFEHAGQNTSIRLEAGTYDELIGGNHLRSPATGKFVSTIGDTSITMSGGTVEYITGGSKEANVDNVTITNGNTSITITGGTVTKLVIGGNYLKSVIPSGGTASNSTATVGDTSVTISGGTFEKQVFAGSVADNYNSNNQVDSDGKPIQSNVGGTSSLTISGGTFKDDVIAGSGAFGKNSSGESDNSSLTIKASSDVTIAGNVVGGSYATNTATTTVNQQSKITLSGDGTIDIQGNVIGGGYSDNKFEGTTTSTANASVIEISGNGTTVAKNIYGGGYAANGSAANVTSSSITIADNTEGLTNTQVFAGGYAETADQSTAEVSSSTISIKNSVLKGVSTGSDGNGTSSVQTAEVALQGVTISDTLDLSAAEKVTRATFAGENTVNKVTLEGDVVEKIVFDGSATNEGGTILTVQEGNIDLSNAGTTTITNAKAGTEIIKAEKGTVEAQDANIQLETAFGTTKVQLGDAASGDSLAITSEGLKIGDETYTGTTTANGNAKVLAESFLGSMAFVNQGAEFIADEGLAAMESAVKTPGVATFGTIRGGSTRYQTGSHVTVDGVSLAAGAAGKIGEATVGGFIEAGWANSDIHAASATGDGDNNYYGAGLAARYRVTDAFYLDGSVRAGWAKTKFSGLFSGTNASYDADSFYTTAHIGVGYIFPITKTIDTDVYARYVYSYLDGDKTDLKGADAVMDADSISTHAVRVGFRLTGSPNDNFSWRAGLAYEHVFDGDADGTLKTIGDPAAWDAPSLSGNTGIAELGATFTPSATSPWAVDAGLKGYVGDRRGVTGNATVRYRF